MSLGWQVEQRVQGVFAERIGLGAVGKIDGLDPGSARQAAEDLGKTACCSD